MEKIVLYSMFCFCITVIFLYLIPWCIYKHQYNWLIFFFVFYFFLLSLGGLLYGYFN